MKLFLVLGILWTIETVHFFVHNHYNEPCQTSKYIKIAFRVLDSCNMLRGFFFFIIFVCKRNVWIKIQRFFFLKFRSPPNLELLESRRSFKQSIINRNRETTTIVWLVRGGIFKDYEREKMFDDGSPVYQWENFWLQYLEILFRLRVSKKIDGS